MDKRIIGQQRDQDGLLLIHKFGWMRAKELGRMLWPTSGRPAVNASELIGKWKRNRWVLARPLPDNMGQALVLSAAGAAYLHSAGYSDTVTGKDWGETEAGRWVAPRTWRHELLALGLLTHLNSQGWQVIPERQLRRENSTSQYPDGLAIRGAAVLWIEVENARKTGILRNQMLKGLILASRGRAESLSGHVANCALVGYAIEAKDERGYRLDHRHHVVSALEKQSPVDVPLALAAVNLTGTAGVRQVTLDNITVKANRVSQLVTTIPWQCRPPTPDSYAYEYFTSDGLEYRCGTGNLGWWWSICRDGDELASDDAGSENEARRAVVAEYNIREWGFLR
jgi:Holliday junction resolvase